MDQIQLAKSIAHEAHAGQTGWDGAPYIEHVQRVVQTLYQRGQHGAHTIAAAWLHDVVEDTAWTMDDLRAKGVSENVLTVVNRLTHVKSEQTYADYIWCVTGNKAALQVKLADVDDHLRDLHKYPDRVHMRDKYELARLMLCRARDLL